MAVANVYVDGFNLYYSALRLRFPDCKWLDLRAVAQTFFPTDSINRVRYFTARITARPDDPSQPQRQQAYIRALKATGVEVKTGHFQSYNRFMKRAAPCPAPSCPAPDKVEVLYTEEKGSDVNLATYLLHDAFTRDMEMAIVVTNDGDLVEPIRLVRDVYGIKIALLSPAERPSKELSQLADSGVKKMRHGPLSACQLSLALTDAKGAIHRPRAWRPAP